MSFDPSRPSERLAPLSLFPDGIVDLNVLGVATEIEGAAEAWEEILEAAAKTGLLTREMESVYRMAPGLGESLEAEWRERSGGSYAAERETALTALLRGWAVVGEWLGDQLSDPDADDLEIAREVLDLETASLLTAGSEALDRRMFAEALSILEPLQAAGRLDEARIAQYRRIVEAEGEAEGLSPEPDTDAGALWFFLTGAEAGRLHRAGDLDSAEERYHLLRGMLERSPSGWARSRLAATLHQLSILAHQRGDAQVAEAWHQKAVETARLPVEDEG